MRVRLLLAAIVAGIMMLAGTGQSYAACVTPCIPGQSCVQACQEIPDLIA